MAGLWGAGLPGMKQGSNAWLDRTGQDERCLCKDRQTSKHCYLVSPVLRKLLEWNNSQPEPETPPQAEEPGCVASEE